MAKEDGAESSALGWPALLVLPVMALAFYLAFIPHQDYPYPVHIDEWVHLANAEAIMKAGTVAYTEPFLGLGTFGPGNNLELGFQLFWGVFQRISGLDWMTIFRFFPSPRLSQPQRKRDGGLSGVLMFFNASDLACWSFNWPFSLSEKRNGLPYRLRPL